MSNGEFFRIVGDALKGSQAHADLIEICRKAKSLQSEIRSYLDNYGDRELSSELLISIEAQLTPEQADHFLEQMEAEIADWDHNVYSDVRGFDWGLSTFTDVIEGQIYGTVDVDDATDEETERLIVLAGV